ncbi:TetR/AcrR family transcriptional regulator [Compostimonas suwonensis]|uniref:Regulatory TetR family protein n=1 Tax=Compostimonas suwonensis TaxID=1048394 RepID=A0A2M9BUH0_9MICO|nr:TetR/AcrR family transcriptional regulator [Compostimonas suwonensis]PJJ61596.1 regulatory TetR family protein [Compostimonas suwonensis]
MNETPGERPGTEIEEASVVTDSADSAVPTDSAGSAVTADPAEPVDPVEEGLIPHAVAVSWGVAAFPQKGPKRELTIERIVDAAISIADDDGLGAVSMSRVAQDLGFTTMSLYRYVSAKDDLLTLMEDVGLGPAPRRTDPVARPASASGGTGWREGLQEWAAAILGVYGRHPWLLDIPVRAAPMTPNNLSWLDWGLQELAGTPLSDQEKLMTVLLVSGYTRWQGALIRDMGLDSFDAQTQIQEADVTYDRVLRTLVTEDRFPTLGPMVQAGLFDPRLEQDPFAYGLDRVLDGVQFSIDHHEEVEVHRIQPAGSPADPRPDSPAAPPAGARIPSVSEQALDDEKFRARLAAEAERRATEERKRRAEAAQREEELRKRILAKEQRRIEADARRAATAAAKEQRQREALARQALKAQLRGEEPPA